MKIRSLIAALAAVALVLTGLPASGFTVNKLDPAPAGSINVAINELVDGNWDSRREAVNFDTGEMWPCPNMPYTSGPCSLQSQNYISTVQISCQLA